jgi:uncharacterized protein (TIGR00297 family)
MTGTTTLLICVIAGAMVLSVMLKKLTVPGALAGGLVALGIYAGAGITGLVLLGAFFILGTAATAHKQAWKEQARLSEKKESQRTAGQVFANGGMAGLIGITVMFFPEHARLLQTMLAASLAAATADTLSSELGVVYGRRFYNICTGKHDNRGLDGVVSWEGTWIGVAGSTLIALLYAIGFGWSVSVFWIVLAGTVGNIADSYAGAIWERSHLIGNNTVNFLNTLVAALVVLVVHFF